MSEPGTITVSRDQVSAARALVAMSGGADKVDPLIAKVASAEPRSRAVKRAKAS